MIWFLPGCTTAAHHPEAAEKLKDYIMESGIPEAPCCKRDISALKDGDTVITCCTLCDLMFAERMPDVRIKSVYEYLLEDPGFPWPDLAREAITLQDCWRKRNDRVIQAAVRACLHRMNVQIVELPDERDRKNYCGIWLNEPADPVCMRLAPETFEEIEKHRSLLSKEEQAAAMQARVMIYPTEKVIVYCNGCERGIRLGGRTPVHMVELLAMGL